MIDIEALQIFLMDKIIMKRTNWSTLSYYNSESLIYYNTYFISSHTFWVKLIVSTSFLAKSFCKFQNLALNSKNMGGNRWRYEQAATKNGNRRRRSIASYRRVVF